MSDDDGVFTYEKGNFVQKNGSYEEPLKSELRPGLSWREMIGDPHTCTQAAGAWASTSWVAARLWGEPPPTAHAVLTAAALPARRIRVPRTSAAIAGLATSSTCLLTPPPAVGPLKTHRGVNAQSSCMC